MSDQERQQYAEQYVWAKKNLTSTPEICHAAARAAVEVQREGGDPQAAARSAALKRSGPGWQTRADPETRAYAEWYDWARRELKAEPDRVAAAAAAAVRSLQANPDTGAAVAAARAAAAGESVAGGPEPVGPVAANPTAGDPGREATMQPQPSPPPYSPAPYGQPHPGQPPYQPQQAYGQQPHGQQPYGPTGPGFPGPGGAGYWPGYQAGGTDGFAVGALICALLGLPGAICYGVPGLILGGLAIIFGRISAGRIRAGQGMRTGSGLATAGWIIGIVDIVLAVIVLIFVVLALTGAFGNLNTTTRSA